MATPRKCLSTDDEFWQAVAESLSVRQVMGRIGLVPAGGNYKTVHSRIQQLGLDTNHFTGADWNVGCVQGLWSQGNVGGNNGRKLSLCFHTWFTGPLASRRVKAASVRALRLGRVARTAYSVRTSSPQWHQQ